MRSNSSSLKSWRICGPIINTILNFATLIPGNFSVRHLDDRPVWFTALTNFFYSPSFMCRGDSKMLQDSTSSMAVHFSSRFQWLTRRPTLLLVIRILCSTVSFTQEKAKLCVALLQSKQYGNNFQVSAKLHAFQKKLLVVTLLIVRLLLSLPEHFNYWLML